MKILTKRYDFYKLNTSPPVPVRSKCHHKPIQVEGISTPRLMVQWFWQGFSIFASWVQALACMHVIPVVLYLSTELAGYLVGSGISHGACKLTQTPRVIYIKKS